MTDGGWTYDDIRVEAEVPRQQSKAIRLSIGDIGSAAVDPFEATRVAAQLVQASWRVVPPRHGGALLPEEFALLVKLLRRYAEFEMDQWETFSFTTSFGTVHLVLTLHEPEQPDFFHTIDGFAAGTLPDGRSPAAESSDGWSFTLADERIERVHVDQRVTFELRDGTKVVVATPFGLMLDGASTTVDPEMTAALGPVLGILRHTVHRIDIFGDGVLTVDLGHGARIDVPADPAYENWELILPDGTLYVGLPGGGVAVFPAT